MSEIQIISDELTKELKSNLKKPKKSTKKDVEVITDNEDKKPTKMVKILMKENHKCCIGGEWYYLLEGKHYNVPENVKEILNNAGKLLPL